MDRAERRHRLLKDQGNIGASDRANLFAAGVQPRQVDDLVACPCPIPNLTSEENLAIDDAPRRVEEAQDRPRGHRLAAPALAYQSQRAAGIDVEADILESDHGALVEGKVRRQVPHGQQWLSRG